MICVKFSLSLQVLVQHPEVQRSRVLSSFLSEQSDEFMPDSVKDRAGELARINHGNP